jgi:hypothetical protein
MMEGQQAGAELGRPFPPQMDALNDAYDGFDPALLVHYGEGERWWRSF